jgi:uncharacterized protein (TIGR00290 family)
MLALARARAMGIEVRVMLSMFEEHGERNRSHGIPRRLIEAQARALGLEFLGPASSWAAYEAVFVGALEQVAARGIDTAVFGDIDLEPHREWEERVCARVSVNAVLPLWHNDRTALAQEILEHGIRAVVVCTDSQHLDDAFCGRPYDRQFLADLPDGVCPCGENGEFHTFVTDAPGMSAPLDVTVERVRAYVSPPELGSRRYCFADLR